MGGTGETSLKRAKVYDAADQKGSKTEYNMFVLIEVTRREKDHHLSDFKRFVLVNERRWVGKVSEVIFCCERHCLNCQIFMKVL